MAVDDQQPDDRALPAGIPPLGPLLAIFGVARGRKAFELAGLFFVSAVLIAPVTALGVGLIGAIAEGREVPVGAVLCSCGVVAGTIVGLLWLVRRTLRHLKCRVLLCEQGLVVQDVEGYQVIRWDEVTDTSHEHLAHYWLVVPVGESYCFTLRCIDGRKLQLTEWFEGVRELAQRSQQLIDRRRESTADVQEE